MVNTNISTSLLYVLNFSAVESIFFEKVLSTQNCFYEFFYYCGFYYYGVYDRL